MHPTPASTVLILGANGRFGLAAARAFAAAGWRVIAQVRRTAAPEMPAGAEVLNAALDAGGAAIADALPRGAAPSILVHAINPIYTRWDQEALAAARAAMALAERLGARFMLPGNVYNYGAAMPECLDEATPQRPSTAKGRLRAEMERELEDRCNAGLQRGTVITAGDFFGAGTGSWFDLVVAKDVARARITYPGDPALRHAWAYLPDLARAFVAVAARPQSAPFVRYTFAGHSVTGSEFVAALQHAAVALGQTPSSVAWKRKRLPWRLIAVAGLVVPMWRELARMAYLWHVSHGLSSRALEAAVGPLASTPLDQAMTESLRGLRGIDSERRPATRFHAFVDSPSRQGRTP